ncbi:MRG/MORF4L-binding protein isoform X2 [Strongylocentrotus purpuratus]|uniref:MRG-binding protein n=1 Tax=Strongylocentrotus purpuratus TaxID=7668 RepID=A0A7M7RE51_STRPU|nr:MRG/MORF4L-binding protein isoform X2 [Strongylocentrotus purpuratus]|eukprot:XP_793425.1 PREDICTED: MRG/MORF4L-binding protein isoform X2 [Strongylocentrotus purpuratus]
MAIGKMSGESVKVTGEDLIWNTELEVSLFYAMRGHKPVGVNKNFQMMCIHEKFNQATGRQVTSKQIWDHLETLYDMQALHESEILPFPNKEVDFSLPTSEFQEMMQQRGKSGEPFKGFSSSSHDSSKSDSARSSIKFGTPSGVTAGTPSEKDNSPKRKRTRQAGTPTETPSTKRRR